MKSVNLATHSSSSFLSGSWKQSTSNTTFMNHHNDSISNNVYPLEEPNFKHVLHPEDSEVDKEDSISSSGSNSSSCEEFDDIDIVQQIRDWDINENVCHSSLGKLLQILNSKLPEFPKDLRTLLKTPTSTTASKK